MIFGSTIMVDDKSGLSTKDNFKEESSHPEYEYRMVSLSMSSNDAIAITRCGVAQHIYDSNPLSRGDYRYHKSMFEKDISLSRYIKANIDMESISDSIYCISTISGEMVAISPSQVRISIREIKNENSLDIYLGEFYFDDSNEKREYPFKKGDNSLSLSLNLDSTSFSRIFESLKNGDTLTEFNINFPAYASWLDTMAGVWPTTYIIKPESNEENFICLSSISCTRNLQSVKEEAEEVTDLYDEVNEKTDLKDINSSIGSTNELLLNYVTNTKKMSTYLGVISFLLALLTIKVFL